MYTLHVVMVVILYVPTSILIGTLCARYDKSPLFHTSTTSSSLLLLKQISLYLILCYSLFCFSSSLFLSQKLKLKWKGSSMDLFCIHHAWWLTNAIIYWTTNNYWYNKLQNGVLEHNASMNCTCVHMCLVFYTYAREYCYKYFSRRMCISFINENYFE